MEPAELFDGDPVALAVRAQVAGVLATLGPVDEVTTRSQVAYRRRRRFAWLWPVPEGVRSDVPVVLSVALGRVDGSPRWKQVVQPSSRHWMHHLEVRDVAEVDDEVRAWLREAYERAG